MTINFTMLCHNRLRLTQQALDSLGKHEGMNVTILAHNCDHETNLMIVNWLKGDLSKRRLWMSSQTMGTGEARNQVIQNSEYYFGRSDLLYLSDNDIFVKRPDWMDILVKSYEIAWDKGFRVIGGYSHPYHQPVASYAGYGDYLIGETYALPSQSMLMRWEVFDKYGPFCQTPAGKVCQSEDVDFTNKIRADGFKIGVIAPALLVNTGITNSFGEKIPGWEMVKAECPDRVICE